MQQIVFLEYVEAVAPGVNEIKRHVETVFFSVFLLIGWVMQPHGSEGENQREPDEKCGRRPH